MVFCCCENDSARAAILEPLPEPHEFEPSKERIQKMVIIGHTTPSTVKIWVRVPKCGRWSLMLSPDKDTLARRQGTEIRAQPQASQKEEHCLHVQSHEFPNRKNPKLNHCFEFSGLQQGTKYYYALCDSVLGKPVIGAIGDEEEEYEDNFFTTAKEEYQGIKFVAYSCHDPYSWEEGKRAPGAWPQFAAIRNDDIDLTIGGGDQVYVDSNEIAMTDIWILLKEHREELKAKYVNADGILNKKDFKEYLVQLIREYYLIYWNDQDLAKVHGRVPAYMMWDDHEIMDGWGSLDSQERIDKLALKVKEPNQKLMSELVQATFEAAAQVYAEFQHSHNPGSAFLPGRDDPQRFVWDFSFCRGKEYQFFAMDMRGAHDVESAKDRLLGNDQHLRLQTFLDRLDGAEAAFIVSPVPVVHWSNVVDYSVYFVSSLKDDLMDAWQHPTNHDERARLLTALFVASEKYNIPIMIVSGDVHCASTYTLTDENYPNARIVQVTSSSISRKPVPSGATLAFAPTGYMKRREDDGKGKEVKTSIFCKYRFGMAGVNNFAVIGAKGRELSVTYFWPGKKEGEVENAEVNIVD